MSKRPIMLDQSIKNRSKITICFLQKRMPSYFKGGLAQGLLNFSKIFQNSYLSHLGGKSVLPRPTSNFQAPHTLTDLFFAVYMDLEGIKTVILAAILTNVVQEIRSFLLILEIRTKGTLEWSKYRKNTQVT